MSTSLIPIAEAYAALSGNGTAAGYITVTSNANFYPGARVTVWSDTVEGTECIITDLVSTDKIGLRVVQPYPTYGRNTMAAFTVADNAKINQPGQLVQVTLGTIGKIKDLP